MDKLTNVVNRVNWLHSIIEGSTSLKDVQPQSLKDAKAFCAMSIDGAFEKISYNTLKACLRGASISFFNVHSCESNISYFLELRSACYKKLEARSIQDKPPRREADAAYWKLLHREALWHANLCANAYLTLRRDLQALLSSNSEDVKLDYKRLERILSRSSSVYQKIISSDLEPLTPNLKVVSER